MPGMCAVAVACTCWFSQLGGQCLAVLVILTPYLPGVLSLGILCSQAAWPPIMFPWQ